MMMIHSDAQHTAVQVQSILQREWSERASPLFDVIWPALNAFSVHLAKDGLELWIGDTLNIDRAEYGLNPEIAFRIIDRNDPQRRSAEYRISISHLPSGLQLLRLPLWIWEQPQDMTWSLRSKLPSEETVTNIVAIAAAEVKAQLRQAV